MTLFLSLLMITSPKHPAVIVGQIASGPRADLQRSLIWMVLSEGTRAWRYPKRNRIGHDRSGAWARITVLYPKPERAVGAISGLIGISIL